MKELSAVGLRDEHGTHLVPASNGTFFWKRAIHRSSTTSYRGPYASKVRILPWCCEPRAYRAEESFQLGRSHG